MNKEVDRLEQLLFDQPQPKLMNLELAVAAAQFAPLLDFGKKTEPIVRSTPKIRRNEACPCGSGKKFKRCCLKAQS